MQVRQTLAADFRVAAQSCTNVLAQSGSTEIPEMIHVNFVKHVSVSFVKACPAELCSSENPESSLQIAACQHLQFANTTVLSVSQLRVQSTVNWKNV